RGLVRAALPTAAEGSVLRARLMALLVAAEGGGAGGGGASAALVAEALKAAEMAEPAGTAAEGLRRVTLARLMRLGGRERSADGQRAEEILRSVLELPVGTEAGRMLPVRVAVEGVMGLTVERALEGAARGQDPAGLLARLPVLLNAGPLSERDGLKRAGQERLIAEARVRFECEGAGLPRTTAGWERLLGPMMALLPPGEPFGARRRAVYEMLERLQGVVGRAGESVALEMHPVALMARGVGSGEGEQGAAYRRAAERALVVGAAQWAHGAEVRLAEVQRRRGENDASGATLARVLTVGGDSPERVGAAGELARLALAVHGGEGRRAEGKRALAVLAAEVVKRSREKRAGIVGVPVGAVLLASIEEMLAGADEGAMARVIGESVERAAMIPLGAPEGAKARGRVLAAGETALRRWGDGGGLNGAARVEAIEGVRAAVEPLAREQDAGAHARVLMLTSRGLRNAGGAKRVAGLREVRGVERAGALLEVARVERALGEHEQARGVLREVVGLTESAMPEEFWWAWAELIGLMRASADAEAQSEAKVHVKQLELVDPALGGPATARAIRGESAE
ncbi:MAG: hypothetical protein ACT4PL_08930, partial [Phycisphaerales bacterium]